MSEHPTRTDAHNELDVFLGDWSATGTAHGSEITGSAPWSSTHTGRWHTGQFFLIQDERARVGEDVFDTLGVLGVDPETGRYVMRTFDNGGHYRHYQLATDGNGRWTISGATERGEIIFSEDNRTQTIHWDWKPDQTWQPLCDRVAHRND